MCICPATCGPSFWPSHLHGLKTNEEDENQLAAARTCRWSQIARISMKCTNRQARYLPSADAHTYRHTHTDKHAGRSSHTHYDSGITRALDRVAVWQKQLFSEWNPGGGGQLSVKTHIHIYIEIYVCIYVEVCVCVRVYCPHAFSQP